MEATETGESNAAHDDDAIKRAEVMSQYAAEKAALSKKLAHLISDFEMRWHLVLVRTSCTVTPRDETDPNSLPITKTFFCDFGC